MQLVMEEGCAASEMNFSDLASPVSRNPKAFLCQPGL